MILITGWPHDNGRKDVEPTCILLVTYGLDHFSNFVLTLGFER